MKLALQTKLVAGFALATALLLTVVAASYRSTVQLLDNESRTQHSLEVLTGLSDLLATMTEAQTGMRGYALTGDPSFLDSHHRAMGQAEAQFQALRRLTMDNPDQQRRLDTLEPLVTEQLDRLRKMVELRRTRGFDAARNEIATGKGLRLHEAIRATIGELQREEDRLRQAREQSAAASARFTLAVIAAGGLGVVLLAITMLVILYRGFTARERIEKQLQSVVESTPNGLIQVNIDGKIVLINTQLEKLFGYARAELIGQPIETLVPERFRASHPGLRRGFFADATPRLMGVGRDLYGLRKDGREIPIEIGLNPMTTDEGTFVLASIVDISERKQAEAALHCLNAELRQASEQAQAADRVKSAFLATMSHELRTPLNSIIGFTGILLQEMAGPLNPEQGKQLDMVRNSARHLLALISDVLDISKIEAGQLEVAREPFELLASVHKVVGIVKPLAEKKGLALRVELPERLATVTSDPRRFEQILLNLINNAIKFTERGAITVSVDTLAEYQSPHGDAAGAAVRLRVTDTGMGITPQDLATLFQPFRQLDTGFARNHEGTGLGLAICRRLAELMGGEVTAASEWEKGSVFSLVLPLGGPNT